MLRARQRIGKYRIIRRIGGGGFASVFEAQDTIEGVAVALKVPHPRELDGDARIALENEVRHAIKLDHPNILPPKNATIAGGHFVVAYPLGEKSLADRLRRRLATRVALDFAEQAQAALAYAHQHQIIHCDIKPENFILFAGDQLRLADFGIAKVAARTIRASGSGTLGYVAPEQAMGRPSYRSDVFALGLLIHRMLSGELPEYPFATPLPGDAKIRKKFGPELLAFLHRALELDPKRRFADAKVMLNAWRALKGKIRIDGRRPPRKKLTRTRTDWRVVRRRQFVSDLGAELGLTRECGHCHELLSESMVCCPWCGSDTPSEKASAPGASCVRCHRGVKNDWRYCAWCYGARISDSQGPRLKDCRQRGHCDSCHGPSVAFSRYCPWCRRKQNKAWTLEARDTVCPTCEWGVADDYWGFCPWCSEGIDGG
ncbi:MAG: serine/threonine-protein kinase [Planctomycetota bacterium]